MGSRGYRRLCRRARAEIRRRRREAMIGACNPYDAMKRIAVLRKLRNDPLTAKLAGLDGLVPLDLLWPAPLNALHRPLVQGTIGGKPRVSPYMINPAAPGILAGFAPGERKTSIEFEVLMHRPRWHCVMYVP